jgi:dephospho-CoA kinase
MRIKRVMTRSGLSQAEVLRIVATQASDDQRLAVSDASIENAGTLEDLSRAVEMLHRRLLADAQASARK